MMEDSILHAHRLYKERMSLPTDAASREQYPMADGLLDYFPNALAEVSRLSKVGNDQHNPGQPMHHNRDKSTDHANKVIKHLVDRGKFDTDGVRHSVKAAWRALALAQEEIERDEGAPLPRGCKTTKEHRRVATREDLDAAGLTHLTLRD
jgi:polyhydroxyalkanoate synthesis regulator phasin